MAMAMASISPGYTLFAGQACSTTEAAAAPVRASSNLSSTSFARKLQWHRPTTTSAPLPQNQMQPPRVKVSTSASASASASASVIHRWAAAAAVAAVLHLTAPAAPAHCSEFTVLSEGPPKESFVVDDAGVLSRVTKSDLKRLLSDLEERKGFHINFVTLRKLTSKADSFEFADQVLERWYPTIAEGNDKGVAVLVTTQKEGAVTGGPAFTKAVGDKILEAVVSENLPVLATDEKYNEAVYSTAKRLVAAIDGLPDPGGPTFQENKRESNFKTRQETEEKRGQFTTVVGGLLVIAFVVPMAQYYAYLKEVSR